MVEDFEGRDISVKRIRVLELLVPRLVDNLNDEFIAWIIGRFVEYTFILLGFMFSLISVNFSSRSVLVNCVVV